MGIREWLKEHVSGEGDGSEDRGPSFLDGLLHRNAPRQHALGEYTAESYPEDVVDLVRRRQQVSEALLDIDVTRADARRDAIPRLKELLAIYPHALVYEALIHAYMDSGRYDEAKGVAFAARERRLECERAELPELRAEIDYLRAWDPEEIDRLREERGESVSS